MPHTMQKSCWMRSSPQISKIREPASKTKLSAIFINETQKFTYIYDFGDDWEHKILLEKILPEKVLKASCMSGSGACPPEDCGGPWGYERLKEILKDPDHLEFAQMTDWMGIEDRADKFDPNEFNLEYANNNLSNI